MSNTPMTTKANTAQMLTELHRLVEAIDRRMPRQAHVGEATIAREAAGLRERAISLIREIEEKARRT